MTEPLGQIVAEPVDPQEAIEFFRSKGLAPPDDRFDYRDWWGANHARGFVVAKAMDDDVLQTIRDEVDRALSEGRTLDQFRADLEPKLRKLGWWGRRDVVDPATGSWENVQLGSQRRLQVIFDTNMRTSYAAGRWVRIQRTKDRFPYLIYRQIQRPTKRDTHVPFHDLVLPVDAPFWAQHFPPNGYFCGCTVRQLTEGALRRRGLKVSRDPTGQTRKVQNKRTGEIEDVPLGVTPGFDNNPGAEFLAARARHAGVAGNMTPEMRGMERGLIEEARQRGLRTGHEHLGVLDLDQGQVVDWTTDRKRGGVNASPDVLTALRDPNRRMALVHNHPSSSPFSEQDFRATASLPGLESLVAAGHDGSIYKISEAAPTLRGAIRKAYATAEFLIARLAGTAEIDDRQLYRLRAHLAASALARRGHVRYEAVFGPGMRLTADRLGKDVIDDYISLIADVLEEAGL